MNTFSGTLLTHYFKLSQAEELNFAMNLRDTIIQQPDLDQAIKVAIKEVQALDGKYNWVGVYLLEGAVLTLAADHYLGADTVQTRIPLSDGICGAAARAGETLIIDDVRADPRYIACSLTVRSEIVAPILWEGTVVGVLDLDSDTVAAFGAEDRRVLEDLAGALARVWEREHWLTPAGD